MSNTAVGQVYKRVIDTVIEASRNDFEEIGINYPTLLALQERWQTRLTATQRASFPWDPQPEPTPEATPTPTASQRSQPSAPPQQPQPPAQQQRQYQARPSAPAASPKAVGVPIKQEPQDSSLFPGSPMIGANANAHPSNNDMAAQRAHEMVQKVQREQQQQAQRYGSQGSGMGQGQQMVNGLPTLPQANVQQTSQRPQNQPQFKQEARAPLGIPQTDGADEVNDGLSGVSNDREARRIKADRVIRRIVEGGAQRLEAGGLLVPLSERPAPHNQALHRQITDEASSSTAQAPPSQPARYDGADLPDDPTSTERPEVAPADAITSDLDDSDEEAIIPNIEDDDGGDRILCLYDKVQRTKNKWKCTLKDGVVNVDGKDYVFHKATGEFEW